jgi:hypothetical protein
MGSIGLQPPPPPHSNPKTPVVKIGSPQSMSAEASVRCLDRCTRLGEAVIRANKPRLHSSRTFSTGKAWNHDIYRPTTLQAPAPKQNLTWGPTFTPVVRRRYASQAEHDIKRTPLYDLHASKKAKFVPFGGYSMPLYYDDLSHVESHHWTREKASIFDVSHMYGSAPICRTLN